MVLYRKQYGYGLHKDKSIPNEMKRGHLIMPLPLLVTLAIFSILMISGVLWMTENLRLQIEELRGLYEAAGIGETVDVDRSKVEKLIFRQLEKQRKEEWEQTTRSNKIDPYNFARNASLFQSSEEAGVIFKPLAHLTGSTTLRYTKAEGTGITKVTDWETRQGLATLANGMMYSNGDLIIPQDGFYYVYSQVYYRFLMQDQSTDRPYQMIHYLLKQTSYPEPQEILKSVRSSCWSRKAEFGLHTSFQGGVFRFQRGDRIWVACSNLHLVSLDETASFFGAFLI